METDDDDGKQLVSIEDRNVKSVDKEYTARHLDGVKSRLEVSEEQKKKLLFLHQSYKECLMIEDKDTGEHRMADLKNPDDLEELKQTRAVYVYLENREMPKDMKFGVVALKPSSLPFNVSNFFPIMSVVLRSFMDENKHDVNQFITACFLISIPIHVSKLILLITGDYMTPIVDSFSMLRLYIVLVKFFAASDFPLSRKTWLFHHLKKRIENEGEVTNEDLCTIANNLVVLESDLNKFNPNDMKTPGKVINTEYIELARRYTIGVRPLHLSWIGQEEEEEHQDFSEDILRDFEKTREGIIDKLLNCWHEGGISCLPGKLSESIQEMAHYTILYFHAYEITILRLIGSKFIPRQYWADFLTIADLPNEKDINDSIREQIFAHRVTVNTARLQACQNQAAPPGGRQFAAYPTIQDFAILDRFITETQKSEGVDSKHQEMLDAIHTILSFNESSKLESSPAKD